MKKLIFLLFVLVAGGIAFGIFYIYRFGLTINLTEEQLQQRVEEAFPIEQRHLGLVLLTLSDPEVHLEERSDRLHYEMRVRATVFGAGEILNSRARVSGTVRYEPEEAAFFFDDLRIEDLEASGIPGEQREWVRQGLAAALRETLLRHPIYRLGREDLRDIATQLALRDVRVVDQRLRIRLGLSRPKE